MAKARYDKELEREKEKLNKLVDEAFNKGTPFTEDEAVKTRIKSNIWMMFLENRI